MAAPDQLASLVGGNRAQPGPEALCIAQAAQPTPHDRPGCRDSLFREVGVTTDDEADPNHVRVVAPDDLCKGRLVARHGETHQRFRRVDGARSRRFDHALQMLRQGSSDSGIRLGLQAERLAEDLTERCC